MFVYHKPYQIESIKDRWREAGQWWLGEQELHVYQVIAAGTLFELHYYPAQSRWILHKIHD
ncbi:MAG: hypothetical protein WAP20_10375 [Limnochordia bacterium]|jgi:hypothetical protein|nr:hypothetical protein [Bacillota bacterium]HOB09175.1 hypothetical protein [Limnochordia bacterium]NLH31825.1 hypothetical protein [Bacillota bacterium]HPT92953.1 hypothetical protein [Limnochordia bacterium]HPZ31245.1 hypothetical protein [Limnochordia bacterium]